MTAQPLPQPNQPGDDWMAVADAVGVNATRPGHPELLANYRPHPSLRLVLTDDALGALVSQWSSEVADIVADLDVELDHAPCAGPGCEAVLCLCGDGDDACPGTVERECRHLNLLCGDCRADCVYCREDAAYDARSDR